MWTAKRFRLGLVLMFLVLTVGPTAQQASAPALPQAGAKVFINTMPDGFDGFLKAAFVAKKVALSVVEKREDAEFEIKGTSESQKASAAKKIIRLNFSSSEQASIAVSNLKTGETVFAYTVNKESSAHGKQSTAEACAKHLKDAMEKKKG